jgi:hypothetical protein
MSSQSPSGRSRLDRTLSLIITLVPVIVVGTEIMMSHPDLLKTLQMKAALLTKRHADKQVTTWGTISAKAATQYHRARM